MGVEIIRHGLRDEKEAFEVEAAVIDGLRLTGLDLTNRVRGQGTARGWVPLGELIATHSARRVPVEEPVVLIRVKQLYRSDLGADALYQATRKWWRISPRRNPGWAFAVYDGIVREVYRIDGWERPSADETDQRTKQRWAFIGERDAQMAEQYRWADVSEHLPRGSQNPIRYLNC
ncbi:MAG: hypothetical protein AB7V62_03845 [Thermoleophilia bacterium]